MGSRKHVKPQHNLSMGILDVGPQQTSSQSSILKRRGILAQKHNAVFKSKLFHERSREVLSWNTYFFRNDHRLAGFAVWGNGLSAQRTINSWACQTRKWCQYGVKSCKWKKKLLSGSRLLKKHEAWLVTSFWFGLNNLGELRSASVAERKNSGLVRGAWLNWHALAKFAKSNATSFCGKAFITVVVKLICGGLRNS